MSYMTINNRRVTFTNERNVLSVIRKSGIDLPTFCYHSELSTYGACRMCMVENKWGGLDAACSTPPARFLNVSEPNTMISGLLSMTI